MCASPRTALRPRLVAISLIGLGLAGCSADSGRFHEGFGQPAASHGDVTGSIPQTTAPSSSRIESQPLPRIGSADEGTSGGGRGMGSYQPGGSPEVTGSIPAPPQPAWTWEGGTPVTVAPGETLDMIAHRYGVPAAAIMQANNISSPSTIQPGQRLVIPRYRSASAAPMQPRVAPPVPAPVGPPKSALVAPNGVHVVAPGETLNSIARLYGKPVMVLAKANSIPPDTMVKVGDRIVIPEMTEARRAPPPAIVAPPAPRAAMAPAPAPADTPVASIESPHSARLASPTAAVPATEDAVKTAEPAGNLPSFRWPVRGRVIASFGPKPNGVQNDGINLAVPEGTPIKAAEDGVVAYAGSELKGYGNLVLVRHANGYVTAYAHASDISVKRGETVKRGQVIGHSGQTGNVTSPQLHFEIRKGATPVDPAQFLSGA